jgi:hypothetical protein
MFLVRNPLVKRGSGRPPRLASTVTALLLAVVMLAVATPHKAAFADEPSWYEKYLLNVICGVCA